MIQKAAGYGQLVIGSFIMITCLFMHHLMQSVLVKNQTTQVTQPPYRPDLVPCNFWLFPKLKSPLQGKRFQAIDELQENTKGQMTVIGRTVWGPKGPTLKGTETSLSSVQCFLYLVASSISVFFTAHGWILSGQTLYVPLSHGKVPSFSWVGNLLSRVQLCWNTQRARRAHCTRNSIAHYRWRHNF